MLIERQQAELLENQKKLERSDDSLQATRNELVVKVAEVVILENKLKVSETELKQATLERDTAEAKSSELEKALNSLRTESENERN